MKYYCEACERLVPPAAFRIEDGLLVLKCSRCKVEMRCGPEQDAEPAVPLASKAAQGPVIMLASSEAEPDPIEAEPTRRIAVPASILAAIEAKTEEARKKKAAAREPVETKAEASEAAATNLVVLRLAEVQARTEEPEPAEEARPASAPRLVSEPRSVARPASTPARAVEESSPATEDPFMPPPGYCPKCIGVRKEDAVVCPFCGLEFARFRAEEFRSPVLSSTWLGVLELWESKGAHDKILALASEKGELAGLGRLYRIRLAYHPDDAMAKRGREEVLRLATAGSTLVRSAAPDKRAMIRAAGLGLLFFFLIAAAVMIIYQMRQLL